MTGFSTFLPTIDKELEGINRYFSTEEIKVNSDDVKKFEIVEASNKEKAFQEFKRKEGIKLDDIGVNIFIRNENASAKLQELIDEFAEKLKSV